MKALAVVAVTFLFALGNVASAAPCRDAKGKFIVCAPVAAKKCRDAKGKFMKCDAGAAIHR